MGFSVERMPVAEALKVLRQHIEEIYTVSDWARIMGYSRSYFSRQIRKLYKEKPVDLLRKVKLKVALEAFTENPASKAYVVACKTGFGSARALGQFVSRNYSITLPEMRMRCRQFEGNDVRELLKEVDKAGINH